VDRPEQAVKPLGEQSLRRSCLARHGQPSAGCRPVITFAGCRSASANASWPRTLSRSHQYRGVASCELPSRCTGGLSGAKGRKISYFPFVREMREGKCRRGDMRVPPMNVSAVVYLYGGDPHYGCN
jgi:hypothetical protein